ncbi:MAG: hypothetical protein R3A46_07135 [Thermomicrobiales bacterium]
MTATTNRGRATEDAPATRLVRQHHRGDTQIDIGDSEEHPERGPSPAAGSTPAVQP